MAAAAAVMNTGVDAVDSGGQAVETFNPPDAGGQREVGPLARVLEHRLSGSSAVVDAAGATVTQRGDTSTANERIDGGPR